jgi:lactam utilization protein B
MDINEKTITINKDKENLLSLINNIEKKLEDAIIDIEENNKKHKEFIVFIDLMKMYEIYKWSGLKTDYNQIKKTVTQAKKVPNAITKMYGKIIGYFDYNNINRINNQIKKIGELNQNMLFHFNKLKKVHNDVHNKCKYMVKNNQIIKIEIITDEIKPLIQKLYENYINIQLINKQTNNLKSIKMSIIREITQINEIKHKKIENIF